MYLNGGEVTNFTVIQAVELLDTSMYCGVRVLTIELQ